MNLCIHCGHPVEITTGICSNCNRANNFSNSEIDTSHIKNENPFRFLSGFWLLAAFALIFIIFLPLIIHLDFEKGGMAVSFLAGFLAVLCLILVLIYSSRAKEFEKIISHQTLIVKWEYNKEEWEQFCLADLKTEKREKRVIFGLIAALNIGCGILIGSSMGSITPALISLLIIPVVAVPAYLIPLWRYKKIVLSKPIVLIAENGVIAGKRYHLWESLGARLDSIEISNREFPEMLTFHYSVPMRNGRRPRAVRVPVPARSNNDISKITELFTKKKVWLYNHQ